MSDLFHEAIPERYIYDCFVTMAKADWHVYQVLTKRPERMKELFDTTLREFGKLSHIWLGVSVENRKHGLPRIPILRRTACAVRFLSIEPLLEDLGAFTLTGIDWVIVGGESGGNARPMDKAWVLNIKRQCRQQTVPFFFKQWGGVRKSETGRAINGREYNEMPHFYEGAVAVG